MTVFDAVKNVIGPVVRSAVIEDSDVGSPQVLTLSGDQLTLDGDLLTIG